MSIHVPSPPNTSALAARRSCAAGGSGAPRLCEVNTSGGQRRPLRGERGSRKAESLRRSCEGSVRRCSIPRRCTSETDVSETLASARLSSAAGLPLVARNSTTAVRIVPRQERLWSPPRRNPVRVAGGVPRSPLGVVVAVLHEGSLGRQRGAPSTPLSRSVYPLAVSASGVELAPTMSRTGSPHGAPEVEPWRGSTPSPSASYGSGGRSPRAARSRCSREKRASRCRPPRSPASLPALPGAYEAGLTVRPSWTRSASGLARSRTRAG